MTKEELIAYLENTNATHFCVIQFNANDCPSAPKESDYSIDLNEKGKADVVEKTMHQLQYEIDQNIGFGELARKVLNGRIEIELKAAAFQMEMVDHDQYELSCLASNYQTKEVFK